MEIVNTKSPPFACQKTFDFLKKAVYEDKADQKKPTDMPVEKWQRLKEVVFKYECTPASMQEIGDEYKISRERVRQLIRRGFALLYLNCSKSTQTEFPFTELKIRKPTEESIKEELALEDLKKGKRIKEVVAYYQLSTYGIGNIRTKARNANLLNIPSPSETAEIVDKIAGSTSKAELNEIFAGIDYPLYRRIRRWENSHNNPVLLTISEIVSLAGMKHNPRNHSQYRALLEGASLPLGTVSFTCAQGKRSKPSYYFFTSRQYLDYAIQALSSPHLSQQAS